MTKLVIFVVFGVWRVELFRKARYLVFWACSHIHYVRAAMALVRLHKSIICWSQSPLEDYAVSTISYVLADILINRFNPLSANRNKSRLLFSSAEMFKKPLWQTVWTQIRLLCSGSTLFDSILYLSVILGNYLQQRTSADDIFRCIFFLAL